MSEIVGSVLPASSRAIADWVVPIRLAISAWDRLRDGPGMDEGFDDRELGVHLFLFLAELGVFHQAFFEGG
jgi:hypothetical protein